MTDTDPHNERTYRRIEVPSRLSEVRKPADAILEEISQCGYDEDACFGIKLALEEALTNAVKHGNAGDPSKRVIIRYAVSPEMVVICVKDEGPGFDPQRTPDPTAPERISPPCGRGIMLIKAYMNDVEYRCDGREVRMVKMNPGPAGTSPKQ